MSDQEPQQQPQQQDGEGGGSKVPGWVWFVLIYGVGNFILYQTTGILLLPIPRR